jgi:hypothetical protein
VQSNEVRHLVLLAAVLPMVSTFTSRTYIRGRQLAAPRYPFSMAAPRGAFEKLASGP